MPMHIDSAKRRRFLSSIHESRTDRVFAGFRWSREVVSHFRGRKPVRREVRIDSEHHQEIKVARQIVVAARFPLLLPLAVRTDNVGRADNSETFSFDLPRLVAQILV